MIVPKDKDYKTNLSIFPKESNSWKYIIWKRLISQYTDSKLSRISHANRRLDLSDCPTDIERYEFCKTDIYYSRRKERIKQAEHRCEICNSVGNSYLQIHHSHYSGWKGLFVGPTYVLCRWCHIAVHGYDGHAHKDLVRDSYKSLADTYFISMQPFYGSIPEEDLEEVTEITWEMELEIVNQCGIRRIKPDKFLEQYPELTLETVKETLEKWDRNAVNKHKRWNANRHKLVRLLARNISLAEIAWTLRRTPDGVRNYHDSNFTML